jgi:hypothetical protein
LAAIATDRFLLLLFTSNRLFAYLPNVNVADEVITMWWSESQVSTFRATLKPCRFMGWSMTTPMNSSEFTKSTFIQSMAYGDP